MASINDLQYQTLDASHTGALNDKLKSSGEPYFQGNDVDYAYYGGGGSAPTVYYDNQDDAVWQMGILGLFTHSKFDFEANFSLNVDNNLGYLFNSGRNRIRINADGTVYVRFRDSNNARVREGTTTETITVADGAVTLTCSVDYGAATFSLKKNGVEMTLSGNPMISGSGSALATLTTFLMGQFATTDRMDANLSNYQLSYDGNVSKLVDLNTANQTVADWNAGTHDGTQSLTTTGTWASV